MTPLHPKLRSALLNEKAHIKRGLTSDNLKEYEGLLTQLHYLRHYPNQNLNSQALEILKKEQAQKATIDSLKTIATKKYISKNLLLDDIKTNIGDDEYKKYEQIFQQNIKSSQADLIKEIEDFRNDFMPSYGGIYNKWIKKQKTAITRNQHQLNPLKMDFGKYVIAFFVTGLIILLTFYSKPKMDLPPPGKFEPDSTKKNEKLLMDSLSRSFVENDEDRLVELLEEKKFEYRDVFHKTLLQAYHNHYYGSGKQLSSLQDLLLKTADIYQKNYNDPFLKKELLFYQTLDLEKFEQKIYLEQLVQKSGDYSSAEKADSARTTLQCALEISRRIGDVKRETDLLDDLQYILFAGPSQVKALEAAKRIKTFSHSIGYNFREEVACERIASSLVELGEYKEARDYIEQGINIALQLGDVIGMTSLSERLGLIETELGNYPGAVKAFKKAISYNIKSKNSYYEQLILGSFALVHKKMGEFAKSEEYLLQALDLARNNEDPWNEGVVLNNLAILFALLNNYDKSNNYIQQALSIANSHNDDHLKADIKLSIGKVLKKQKNYKEAAFNLEKALEAISHDNTEKYKPKRLESEILLNLADIYTLTNNFTDAIQYYEKSITLFKQTGDKGNIILAETRIADVYRKLKKYDKALNLLEKNTTYARKLNNPIALAYVHYNKGLTFFDMNNYESAEDSFKEAIGTVEKTREKNYTNEKILIDYFATSQDFYEKLILCLYNQGKYDQAYYYTGLSKARVLFEVFQNQKEPGLTDFPDYLEIQKVLGNDIQLIEFKVTDSTLISFHIDQQELKCFKTDVNRTKLRNTVDEFRKAIGADNISAFIKRQRQNPNQIYKEFVGQSKQLYEMLLGPFKDQLATNKIIYIITDDALSSLPFAALVSENGKFIIEDFIIASAPSASVLHFQLDKNNKTLNKESFELFAIGNPTSDLPGSEKEVKAISLLFKTKEIITGKRISKSVIDSAFKKNFNVYHFAMHAFVNEVDPLSSFLLLGKDIQNESISDKSPNDPYFSSENYIFKAYELFNYDLSKTNLVCLSACRTATGKHYGGEGILGLTYAFIRTGVKSVITTQWDIQDKYSASIMSDFYDGWINNGMNKALALREAQLKTINKMTRDPLVENPYPYAWASYSLMGMYN